jgi:saccharopine dehydrogenase (NAD+, L-lysine-forming)
MKVLLAGTGGVGEAIAACARKQDPKAEWLERMVLADINLERAREISGRLKDSGRFPAEKLDAGSSSRVLELAKKYRVDLIMNACSPQFNMPIFEAAFQANCTYMDMAMSLSERHPRDPFTKPHIKLGDLQYAKAAEWERRGLLALLGSGVEPGMVDVFARYAADHLFDEIHELNVRDGANLYVEGLEIAFGFSIWTTIEECLNPPVIWESDKGWYTTEPFSEPEIFDLPEGIGPVEMINVEHEEVLQMPRYFADRGLRRVTFKYGLEKEFIQVLKTLQALGLDSTRKVRVGEVEVAPRDVIAATAPDPAKIGDRMFGKTAAGLWVKGLKDGMERSIYIYQVADNQACMRELGSQAVVAQTAFNPLIMMELLAKGIWKSKGVQNPEAFPAEPFMARMAGCGFPPGMVEMDSPYRKERDEAALKAAFRGRL